MDGGASSAMVNGTLWSVKFGKSSLSEPGMPWKVSGGRGGVGKMGTARGSGSVSCSFSMSRVKRKVYCGGPGRKRGRWRKYGDCVAGWFQVAFGWPCGYQAVKRNTGKRIRAFGLAPLSGRSLNEDGVLGDGA